MRLQGLGKLIVGICLLAFWGGETSLGWAAPAPQTKPWRIAVGGTFCTGYLGLLALHGMPRDRLADQDLMNPEKLRQYDIVLVGMRGMLGEALAGPLLQYIREGGIVVAESGLFSLAASVIPGQRLGPAPYPNIRFVDAGTPLTQGLPELGVIPCFSGNGFTIVPAPDANVKVLAFFTEEQTPDRFRGHFVRNGKGAPAIMMAEVGKGVLIYSAPSIAFNLSLRGQHFEPFICNIIRYFSRGELDDRMYTGSLSRDQLVTLPSAEPEPIAYPKPAGAPAALPEGFEQLAEAEEATDFAVRGKLPPSGTAHVLLSYWTPALKRELILDKQKALLQRQEGEKIIKIAEGALPSGATELLIMRRAGLVSVWANRQLVLSACEGPLRQGVLAVRGLQEVEYQPLDQIYFADDFMRESESTEEWQPLSGRFQITAAEGKPEMGANPFDYVATATDKAIAVNGDWFWRDYAYDISVKLPSAQAAGLLALYRAEDDYVALRLSREAQGGRLQLLRQTPAGAQILGEAPVEIKPQDWYRLGLRTSAGWLMALLDGRIVLQAQQPDLLYGRIGLFCEKGQARFDDIEVRPWAAAGLNNALTNQWIIYSGAWKQDKESLTASGSKGARAFAPWGRWGADIAAQVHVRLGQAAAAGLHFRYENPETYYLMALVREGGQIRMRLYRHGQPGAILAEKVVSADPQRWHRLQAEVRGGRLWAALDGQPVLDVLDPGPRQGLVGLYARGEKPASFKDFFAYQLEPDEQLVDPPTPAFAGIIDRHTWAGRAGAWLPDPAQLNCFWHHGYLPADLNFQIGFHPHKEPKLQAHIHLARDKRADSGYTLQVTRTWAEPRVGLQLMRLGKPVAQVHSEAPPHKPFSVGLLRRGTQLMMEVNRQPVAVYRDPQPLPNLDCLGLDQGGSLIFPDDIAVSSPYVRDYTFETAPTDWSVQHGIWEISSRWSCTPGWAWFSGHNRSGYAIISTKTAYQGDQELAMYVAPKMMPVDERRFSETFGDVYVSLCADPAGNNGYQVAFAGVNSSYTVLRRQGQIVAQSPYRLPQGGEHNDWLKLIVRKHGPLISVWVWSSLILEYQDTEPLSAGHIAIGTRDNGIMIPRVTIFGRPLP